MFLLFTTSDEKRVLSPSLFGQPDPTKLKVSFNVSSWFLTHGVVFHDDSSSESAASSIVQKKRKSYPQPILTVVNYILELLVQRMPWISAPDVVSWKKLLCKKRCG
jgi:hypothetical protein